MVMIQLYSCITAAFPELIIAADSIAVPKPENILCKNSNSIFTGDSIFTGPVVKNIPQHQFLINNYEGS